jgi:DNA-binding CsgD family transcriptional regulator
VTELVEREGLLGRAHGLLQRARCGVGGALLFEGAAGVGKTSLLDVVSERASGFLVARAAPVELERAFGFGVVRHLFDGLRRGTARGERARLFAGPGAAAARVLKDAPRERVPIGVCESVLYGLFWVLSLLAADGPVLLVVDDAQWADEASLAWLAYLAARLREVPVVVMLAARREAGDALGALAAADGVAVEPVPPLSVRGVEALLARQLGGEAAVGLGAVAHAATGGNPFLLGELARAWREQGADRSLASTARLRRMIGRRIARAGPNAMRVAQAVAVLGGTDAAFPAVAELAGLRIEQVLEAAESLGREEVLRGGARVGFVHPLVREAVYDSINPIRRAGDHGRAARLLRALGDDERAIAAQLLLAAPTAEAWTVDLLRREATRALSRGTPAVAAQLLRRALTEPPLPTMRAQVLHELGEAEARAKEPQAERTLRAALSAATGVRSAEVALSLARLLHHSGRGVEAEQVLRGAFEQARRDDPELALRIEAEALAAARTQAGARVAPLRVPTDARPDLAGKTPGERLLLACLTFEAAAGNAPADRIASLAKRALRGDRLAHEQGPESLVVYFAIASLGYVDRYEAALAHLDAMLGEARRDGSVAGYALARAWRADVLFRAGALVDVEADALDALALAREHDMAVVVPLALFPLLLAYVEAGRLTQAEQALAAHGFAEQVPAAGAFAGVQYGRGRLHAAAGRLEQARMDFMAAGRALEAARVLTPAIPPWRSDAGLSIAAAGRPADGRPLVEQELGLARELGAPRPLGLALRAHARLETGAERQATLEAACDALRAAGSPIELARTLADLGIARLRAGARAPGQALLREALDLADRHGAHALAERARRELVVAGARPRRARLTGRDALTPAELRVAQLAAAGRSNREIAAELFLTLKTVETHLGRAYHKLSVPGRQHLASALADER